MDNKCPNCGTKPRHDLFRKHGRRNWIFIVCPKCEKRGEAIVRYDAFAVTRWFTGSKYRRVLVLLTDEEHEYCKRSPIGYQETVRRAIDREMKA